jgi:hypothetical protein
MVDSTQPLRFSVRFTSKRLFGRHLVREKPIPFGMRSLLEKTLGVLIGILAVLGSPPAEVHPLNGDTLDV